MPRREQGRLGHLSLLRKRLPAALLVAVTSQAIAQTQIGVGAQGPLAESDTATVAGNALSGFSFDASAALSEIYTTNGTGLPSSFAGSGRGHGTDFITTLSLNFGVHNRTARFQGDLQTSLVEYVHARNHSLNTISSYLNGIARAVLVPEHLLLDVRAFARPMLVSRLGPLSADDRPIATGTSSGRRDTYGYTIAPDFVFRLGDFATSETTFSHGNVFFFHPAGPVIEDSIPGEIPTNQATNYRVVERFSSGSDFNRLAWALTGTAAKATHMSGGLEEAAGAADLSYALNRSITLVGTAGYSSMTTEAQQLTHSLVGPIALGGIAINRPRVQAEFRAGVQNNFTSYTSRLHYEIGPFTTLNGSVTDGVTTPALNLIGGLGSLGVNSRGDFFDTNYQLDESTPPEVVDPFSFFDPAPIDQIGTAVGSASVSRLRRANLSLLHDRDRTSYGITAAITLRDRLNVVQDGVPPDENITSVSGVVSHVLTPVLTGNVNMGYSLHDALGGHSEVFRTRLSLTWQMSPIMSSFLQASYLHRTSDRDLVSVAPLSDNLSDANIVIGIRRQLF